MAGDADDWHPGRSVDTDSANGGICLALCVYSHAQTNLKRKHGVRIVKIERMQWLRIFAPGSRRCSEVFYNILSIAKVIVTKSKAGLANRLRHLLKYLDFLSLTISIF